MFVNASLLRERFTIRYNNTESNPAIAIGNRILLPLVSPNGQVKERLIIRSHSMHTALRMAATICQEFFTLGPLLNRQRPYDWNKAWDNVVADFERIYAPQTWVCVYNNGRSVYHSGEYHPFLDVIEQCDIKNRAEYDNAVLIAEDVFRQAGKDVSISHEATIGFVIGATDEHARCGLILRAPRRTATFNFKIEQYPEDPEGNSKPYGKPPEPYQSLRIAADFLEAIQLAVSTGFIHSKVERGLIRWTNPEAKKIKSAHRRIGRLNQSINFMEDLFRIRYRPEKPDFLALLEDARTLQKETRI